MKIFVLIITCFCVLKPTEQRRVVSNNYSNRKFERLIAGSMDQDVDPCEDFYEFACGDWKYYHEDAGSDYHELLSMSNFYTKKRFAANMKKLNVQNQPSFVKKVKDYYTVCKDLDDFDHLSYMEWLKNSANFTWPMPGTPRTKTDKFDWVHTLATMRTYGLNGILIEELKMKKRDEPTQKIIDLDKPVSEDGFQPMTYANLEALLESTSLNLTNATITELWEDISNFEESLVELNKIEDEEGSEVIKVEDLQLPWLKRYLEIVLNQTSLDPNMEIRIQNQPYMMALEKLVQQNTDYFVCKYLGIRFLWYIHQITPVKFNSLKCTDHLRGLMALAVHWIYEQTHPELQEETAKIQIMFDNIREQFNKTLLLNHMGFSETILQYLHEKLEGIQLKIGNIPRTNTIQFLEDFYKDLTIDPRNFYSSHLSLLQFDFKSKHADIPDTLSRDVNRFFQLEAYDAAAAASPEFIEAANIVFVPFHTLNPPAYHASYDDVYKYSMVGRAIAHEIFHCFDYTGVEVDPNGRRNSTLYQMILANPDFDRNYKCLEDLNPDVIDEKIADVSGMYYSYKAFAEHFADKLASTRVIKGLDISQDKLFFLSFAQYYCDTSEDDTDHGLPSDRVNDAVTHMRAFSKAYNCSETSKMHASEVCQLWY